MNHILFKESNKVWIEKQQLRVLYYRKKLKLIAKTIKTL